MADCWTVTARWLIPVDAPPLAHGTLTTANGRIVAVESAGRRTPDVDLGNVAILPGLVNAHTHLDLGDLRGRLAPPKDFTEWLRAVVAYRRGTSPTDWRTAIAAGIDECLRLGTTLVGDIAVGGLSGPLLAASPLKAVVFHELIGLTKARAKQTRQEAERWLCGQESTTNIRRGLSPHAPYSVRRSLWRWASRRSVPLAVHWAETVAEGQLLRDHTGLFREFLEEIGAWDEEGLGDSPDWILRQFGPRRPILVHGNYLTTPPTCDVVYCPRTHAYFGHPQHPFISFLEAGVNVALGSDSLASNPDLSILAEMRFLWQRYSDRLAAAQIIRMGTLAGAIALDWADQTGSLTPAKIADWIAVPLDDLDATDPCALLLESRQEPTIVCSGGVYVSRSLSERET